METIYRNIHMRLWVISIVKFFIEAETLLNTMRYTEGNVDVVFAGK